MSFIDLNKIADTYARDRGANLKSVIIKEMLHLDILRALSNSDLSSQIVFQGGTALRLCYQGGRYSEDLDFVLADENLIFDKSLFREFERTFADSMLKKYNLQSELVYPKNDDGLVQKWVAKILLPIENRKEKINIEICKIPSYDNSVKSIENFYSSAASDQLDKILLKVESLEEILADKIVAFGAREYLKYRDIWDIKWLGDKNIAIDSDLISKKISNYNIENFDEKIKNKLDILNNENLDEAFKNEMQRFLSPNLLAQVVKFDFFKDIKKAVNVVCEDYLGDQSKNVRKRRRL
ncbi:nucleotidyl transferase AbiEii/AbiGii toxin family protein [Campylobacter sp. RM16187]|uniref:nucleotidyl transferase AbiEii/AbiGii toxin family protein n=1 Tax=Campylobacter sp. RM16187 TaxID=1660063 RepID=UPI0021B4D898|nr:nucleotidyl transferase AbiEii/AbiGii toxin family protein [Campylobacter sp. RM16187]QKG30268.1 nucleotidyltransferase (DUF1814 domain) [Campylobacter sp. RM16187]